MCCISHYFFFFFIFIISSIALYAQQEDDYAAQALEIESVPEAVTGKGIVCVRDREREREREKVFYFLYHFVSKSVLFYCFFISESLFILLLYIFFLFIATDSTDVPDENTEKEPIEKTETPAPAPEGNKYISNFMALSSSAIKKAQGTTAVQYLQVRAFCSLRNYIFF